MTSRKKASTVKLEDVAKRAKVSIATASIVINTPESKRVSEPTRKRVLEAVEALNYRPASYAQQMRGKNPAILGLIIPDLMNQFYPEVTCGFSDTANQLGYNVILLNSRNEVAQEEFFTDTLISMRVAGVAICGANSENQEESQREKALVKRLISQGISVVRLDRYDDDPICPYVGIDNYQASFCMTEQLILEGGHKKIALFVPYQRVYIQEERCRGYRDAMEKYGLLPSIFETDQIHFTDINEKMKALFLGNQRFTALFNAASDIGAIECIKQAASLGLRVPQDLSIAGFDDIYLANIVNPSLTTICQPKYDIGKTAMQMLARMISNEDLEEKNILLPFHYIKRNSTIAME